MTLLLSPFHLDDALTGDWPIAADRVLDPVLADAAPGSWPRIASVVTEVADAVASSAAAGHVPLVLSGDCVAALGVVAGVQRVGVTPTVVWFDAHGDLQSPETSTSGYLGGMPIRQLLGAADRTVPDAIGLADVDEGDIVLVDARDLDPAEVAVLAASRIRHVPVGPIGTSGPVVVHVDLDVLDAAALPGLLFPVGGGPTLADLEDALGDLLGDAEIVALSLACTTEDRTSDAARRIAELLALSAR